LSILFFVVTEDCAMFGLKSIDLIQDGLWLRAHFKRPRWPRCGHVFGRGGPGHLAAGEGRGSGGSGQPSVCEAPRRPCLYSTRSHSSMHRSLDLTWSILGTMAAWLGGDAPRAPASVVVGAVVVECCYSERWREVESRDERLIVTVLRMPADVLE
jgi:hypothetical protein